MNKMVKQLVNNYDLCQRNKIVQDTKEASEITKTSSKNFEVLSMDIVGLRSIWIYINYTM